MQGHVCHSKVVTARQIWPAGQLLDGQSVRWWMIFKPQSPTNRSQLYWQSDGFLLCFVHTVKLVTPKVSFSQRNLYCLGNSAGPLYSACAHTWVLNLLASVVPCWICTLIKSHILSLGPPTGCHHCGQTLTIDHVLLECALLQECRDEYHAIDSLNALFETIPEACIVEFLAGILLSDMM